MTPAGIPADEAAAGRDPRALATTHWSLVVRAAGAGVPESRAALAELCRTYWRPLYTFARRRGLSPPDAEDLTQAFFADLLGRNALALADPLRGRFRTFLLTAFENFRANERLRAASLRRGGDCVIVSLEAMREAESHLGPEPATTESPEKLFDRHWAHSLLEQVLVALRQEYAALEKADLFDELKTTLWGGRGEVAYAEIGRRLHSTEGAIKVAAHRLRRRVGERLRAEVAKTLVNPADVEDELRFLLEASRSPAAPA